MDCERPWERRSILRLGNPRAISRWNTYTTESSLLAVSRFPKKDSMPYQPAANGTRVRLGFPVKVLGAAGLRSHDSRRWQNQPHLSVSLAYLRDIFLYLKRREIRFYRMAGQLAPYLTHPDLPAFHNQLEECSTELAAIGDMAREQSVRLTLHPGFYVQLSHPDPALAARSGLELAAATSLLDGMGLDGSSVVVVHVGGGHGDVAAALERFARAASLLPESVRRRLVLENGDREFSLRDVVWLHRRTGIPVVLDTLHHRCHNPDAIPLLDALKIALATWPEGIRPKIHVSSPRTAVRTLYRDGEARVQMPLAHQHSDFLHPFEVIDLLEAAVAARLRSFDIMLEAKAKDVALLRLREHISRYAPNLARHVQ